MYFPHKNKLKLHLPNFIIILYLSPFINISVYGQSPYKSSWNKDGLIFGTGGVTFLVESALNKHQTRLTAEEINQLSIQSINWFDRTATYKYSENMPPVSDILVGAAATAPLLFLADPKIKNDWSSFTLMYMETMMFSLSFPTFAKNTVERVRPFVYNKSVPLKKRLTSEQKQSFFSGHTTLAFASAVFLSTVYSDYHPGSVWNKYIWVGSILNAGVVGYLRYESGLHFPSDILAGAVAGSAIGYLIPLLHRIKNNNLDIHPLISRERAEIIIETRF